MTSSSQTFQRSAARLLDLILPGLGLLILGKTFWGSTILMVWTGFIATLVTKVLQLELHLLQSVYLLILIWITSNISISSTIVYTKRRNHRSGGRRQRFTRNARITEKTTQYSYDYQSKASHLSMCSDGRI